MDVKRLVAIMAGMPTAAPTLQELVDETGLSLDALQDLLADADADGLLTIWDESPDGPVVVLSPVAAELAGLRLSEGPERVGRYLFRWASVDAPIPCERNIPERIPEQRGGGCAVLVESEVAGPNWESGGYFDQLEDPSAPRPFDQVEHGERLAAMLPSERVEPEKWTKTSRPMRPPGDELKIKPVHLLGLRPQWNETEPSGPCLGCGDRPLELLEVCLLCCRSGLDHLLAPVPRRAVRARAETPATAPRKADAPLTRKARRAAARKGA